MAFKAGEYVGLRSKRLLWRHVKGEPKGVDEVLLHRHKDGSYTHVIRVKKGIEFTRAVKHDFHEEAYYLEGEMLNTKTRKTVGRGAYVYHRPGEEHGPFKCLKTCLVLEFRYYR